ncbi:MAG: cobalamin B12-binding domain-containing protein, partial [Nitrospira sp.]|nr:cobalamin B12-binding domain-containing protein [Nitrospira sp.]
KVHLGAGSVEGAALVEAVRQHGHEARLTDLHVDTSQDYIKLLEAMAPDVVGFCCHCSVHASEIQSLASFTKARVPHVAVFVNGWGALCVAGELLRHGKEGIDYVVSEAVAVGPLLRALEQHRQVASAPPSDFRRFA